MEEIVRATILVVGKVQGVFYRASTLEEAQRLRLTGWVQNLADGGVEIVVEGPKEAVEELVSWANHGPPMSEVADVRVRYSSALHEDTTFRIVY